MDYRVPAWLLDLVLLFFILEWCYLNFHLKYFQHRLRLLDLNFALAPGFFLILGFRLSANETISLISMACLFFAGVLHAFDLYLRCKKANSHQHVSRSEGSI